MTHVDIQGKCPNCGSRGLFVSSGGYVTCSWSDCQNPSAPSEALGVRMPKDAREQPVSAPESVPGTPGHPDPATQAPVVTWGEWDLRGGPLWLDREQWGIVTDALVEHRASATARKGANSASNSDVRAEMCVQMIQAINTATAYRPCTDDPDPAAAQQERRTRYEAAFVSVANPYTQGRIADACIKVADAELADLKAENAELRVDCSATFREGMLGMREAQQFMRDVQAELAGTTAEHEQLHAEIEHLHGLCSTLIDVHAAVVMDTPEDRALHDEAISTFRASLGVSHLAGKYPLRAELVDLKAERDTAIRDLLAERHDRKAVKRLQAETQEAIDRLIAVANAANVEVDRLRAEARVEVADLKTTVKRLESWISYCDPEVRRLKAYCDDLEAEHRKVRAERDEARAEVAAERDALAEEAERAQAEHERLWEVIAANGATNARLTQERDTARANLARLAADVERGAEEREVARARDECRDPCDCRACVMQAERDEARATIARVKALAHKWDRGLRAGPDNLHGWSSSQVWGGLGDIRAALDPPTESDHECTLGWGDDCDGTYCNPRPPDEAVTEGSGLWLADSGLAAHDPPARAPEDPLPAVKARLEKAMKGMAT